MLPREKGGVVDPSLKVYGTDNIRLADLSVLPLHFAAHTQAAAYTVGEQGTAFVSLDIAKLTDFLSLSGGYHQGQVHR